ncbi:hypothetical protein FRC03_006425 [Tulasnella sp. 419]|nr:hypothetical protein FRC03_006425 [Tulasnella sp. 419]
MLQIRAASTLVRSAEAAAIGSTSAVNNAAALAAAGAGTKGRNKNQPPRPAKPIPAEAYALRKAPKTHKQWNYTRMYQKVPIRLGPISEPRILSHYNNTLADDLLYLTYRHNENPQPQQHPKHDTNNPYTKNRPIPPPKGGRGLRPSAKPTSDENVVKLEKIVIHTMVKQAQTTKSTISSAMALLRQLSGETEKGGGKDYAEGVQLCRARKKSTEFRVPRNLPISVKVEIKGERMYDFIGTLAEFVLPRMRDFAGITMPPPSSNPSTPSATSGVVAFGLPPAAMTLFPQVEVNLDSYPMSHGIHIDFVTNARGKYAQDRARTLVSGFRIPFVRA